VELYFQSPNTPSWRGAQLKSTGTTLPLLYLEEMTKTGLRVTPSEYEIGGLINGKVESYGVPPLIVGCVLYKMMM